MEDNNNPQQEEPTVEEITSDENNEKIGAPNHILQNGKFIYLPAPTSHERAKFFERSVAEYELVSANTKVESKPKKDEDEENSTKKQKEQRIHPLAIASARIQGYGISELSKAINLGGLVVSSDYVDLANIVSQSSAQQTATSSSQSQASATQSQSSTSAVVTSATQPSSSSTSDNPSNDNNSKSEDAKVSSQADPLSTSEQSNALVEEQRLRSTYVLKRKHAQFQKASKLLKLHHKRLKRSLSLQQIIDRRYFTLRQKWKLVAPEHGKVVGPVRPTEVVAIDMDIYHSSEKKAFSTSALARCVPRYVTIQLTETQSTMAEPFFIADPTLGKIDSLLLDPKNAQKLTLKISIEKCSSGFIESANANPSFEGDIDEDERVIIDLQHSLFCASLFDSMKQEVTTEKEPVWISSEMEQEAYLPPGNCMANSMNMGGICIIHVHQGEIKVQLNHEYALSFQLINVGSSVRSVNGASEETGSQNTQELQALCRALLLNAQFIYHDHCMNQSKMDAENQRISLSQSRPFIITQCVHLGAKILLEKKLQNKIHQFKQWYDSTYKNNTMIVQYLDLSFFDTHSACAIAFEGSFTLDLTLQQSTGISVVMNIDNDDLNIISSDDSLENGEEMGYKSDIPQPYRKVTFGNVDEFELFMKFQVKRFCS